MSTLLSSRLSPLSPHTILPMLPPCRICNEEASGFHYGVNTCEACKAFFRRSLKKWERYKCLDSENCEIKPGRRSYCSFCRFKKCQTLGMCKDAIKTGRYTYAKRTQDTLEIKGSHIRRPAKINGLSENLVKVESHRSDISTVNSLRSVAGATFGKTLSGYLGDPNNLEPYEQIIKRIVEVHNTQIHSEKLSEMLPEKEHEYLEQKALKTDVFGQMDSLSRDEYLVFYNMTGIDLDGRHELIETVIIPSIELSIRRFVRFTKAIPGFTDLSVDDQIALVKATRFDAWMIICHRCFNPEKKLFLSMTGKIVHMEDMMKVNDREYVEALFFFELKLKKLNLNLEETCTLAAFVVMFTDNCPLDNPAIVEQSQEQLLGCLGYLFTKYHANDTMRFNNVINCLLQLRTMRAYRNKNEQNFAKDWKGIVNFPPLLSELWST